MEVLRPQGQVEAAVGLDGSNTNSDLYVVGGVGFVPAGVHVGQDSLMTGGEVGLGESGYLRLGENLRPVLFSVIMGQGSRRSLDGKIDTHETTAIKLFLRAHLSPEKLELEFNGAAGSGTNGSYSQVSFGLPYAVAKNIKIVPSVQYDRISGDERSESGRVTSVSLRAAF